MSSRLNWEDQADVLFDQLARCIHFRIETQKSLLRAVQSGTIVEDATTTAIRKYEIGAYEKVTGDIEFLRNIWLDERE